MNTAKKIAITLRSSISANDNDWAGMLYDGESCCFSKSYHLHIVDHVGGGTDAPRPTAKDEPWQPETSEIDENFEPWKPKVRKSGTGCVYQINDHLWEGSYFPRLPDGSRKKFNVYAKTREECETELAKMIEQKKEISELKK